MTNEIGPAPGALDVAGRAVASAREAIRALGPLHIDGGRLCAGPTVLEGHPSIVRELMAGTGFGCTIFRGNVRIATMAVAAGQEGLALGTCASERVTQQVLRGGRTFRGIARTLGKDWLIVYEPLRNDANHILGMISAYRELVDLLDDVSVLGGLAEGVLVHTADGSIIDANQTACDLLGMGRSDLLCRRMSDLHEGVTRSLSEVWTGTGPEPTRAEAFWRHTSGHRIPVELLVSRLPDDRLVTLVRDFSEEYEARRTLAQVNEELRDAERRAIEASRSKSSFLANLSHEFRTPLNAILGYSEMLIEEAEDLNNQSLTRDLRRIHGSGRHLLSLVNNVLDLAKIEAGHMGVIIERFDLGELVSDAASTIGAEMDRRGNQLEITDSVGAVCSDATRVRQCVLNLLSNAAKFTEGGTVSVSMSQEGERVCIEVTDSGIGMSQEQLGRVFEEFEQAETSTTRDFGGTGLGLAVVRQLAGLLEGDVSVSSGLGEGSSFRFAFRDHCAGAKEQPDVAAIGET